MDNNWNNILMNLLNVYTKDIEFDRESVSSEDKSGINKSKSTNNILKIKKQNKLYMVKNDNYKEIIKNNELIINTKDANRAPNDKNILHEKQIINNE